MFAAACTVIAGPKFETMTLQPQQGKALIVVYRRAAVIGDGNRATVWLNDTLIGKLPIESFITLDVEPGTYDLTIGPKPRGDYRSVDVEVEAGKVYYTRLRRGVYDRLREEDEDAAKEELKGMTFIAHPEKA
jgi:hypothetical protein